MINLEAYRMRIETAATSLLVASERAASRPRQAGEWTAKEILGHLIDSASNNHQRFVRAQFNRELIFPTYDQEAWVSVQHYAEEPWERLVLLWKDYNLHLLHLMESTPEAVRLEARLSHNLDQIAFHTVPTSQPASLEYLMQDYLDHLEMHLGQLLEALKAGTPGAVQSRTIVVPLIHDASGRYLICKKPVTLGVFAGQWGLPGGGIEPGERMEEALRRETLEEVGLELESIRPLIFKDGQHEKLFADGSRREIYMIFLIFDCLAQGDRVRLNDEFLEYAWVTPDQLAGYDLNPVTRDTFQKAGLISV